VVASPWLLEDDMAAAKQGTMAVPSVPEVYAFSLASSGKLKLRATSRLAEGTPDATF
jgi:hypothetical protein